MAGSVRLTRRESGPSTRIARAPEQAFDLLNWQGLQEDEETWEREGVEDLALMRQDTAAHLTSSVARLVVFDPSCQEEARTLVLRHLRGCAWCRGILASTLELGRLDPSHPGYLLLERAEEWARMAAAGRGATEDARRSLLERGIGYVYQQGDDLFERLPDGSVRRLGDLGVLGDLGEPTEMEEATVSESGGL